MSQLELDLIVQAIVCGLLLSGVYLLIALSKSLVYSVIHMINVAIGWFMMLGGYIAYFLYQWGVDPLISTPLLIIPSFFWIGLIFYICIIKPSIGKAFLPQIVMTFNVALIIEALATLFWTADYRVVSPPYTRKSLDLFGIKLPILYIIIFIVGITTIISLHLFLTRTYMGCAIRCVAQNREGARIVGIKVEKVEMIATSISTTLAGMSGALLAMLTALTPNIGAAWTVLAITITIIGGLGNIYGAIPASLILAVMHTTLPFIIPAALSHGIGVLLMIIILLIRPSGIFGLKARLM